ncbi:MAG TPA: GNAT family N-acetyltransferase [Gemmatimonadaceae bacterium]|jgi:ribosomal protein S18 acetylase RimI-like enzyme|nr:GNAT family N-acetyltransferase [Gemmatimonadaceae bacterium]
MRVELATLLDLPAIRAVYADAREIQRAQGAILWEEFPVQLTISEVETGRLFRVMDGDALAGVFTVAYEDEAIWGERESGEHIYLHRIARATTYPGRGIMKPVLEWAWSECRRLGRAGLRIDTWASNQALIDFYERQGFRFVGVRSIGVEPRLAPHYQGIELALLEATRRPMPGT